MKTYLKKPDVAGRVVAPVQAVVMEMIERVRSEGDAAVREYSERLDGWSPPEFRLDGEQIQEVVARVPSDLLDDIRAAQANVRSFARYQLDSMREFEIEMMPGVHLGQRHLPVAAAGAYVPGGRYPLLASAHMTVVTAKVAGVELVVACTPPIRGDIPDATVAAMHLAGAERIYLLGGVQAVAALALGTETIPKVDILAGPGNAYVAEAKRQLFGEVGIDLLAGPTEILIVADDTADPFVVAVDLLSQAEHGPDSPAVLITTSEGLARAAIGHVNRLLPDLVTNDCAGPAWRDHGEVVVVDDLDEAYELADAYASEHVEILTSEPRKALEAMRNYGALFLGEGTCVSFGDKVIGTNHTLPTRGAARYTGGLWVGKYLRTVTYQEVTNPESAGSLGELCGRAARAESFEGHARAADLRSARWTGRSPEWVPAGEWAPAPSAESTPA